jgi:3',5'-cyclic-AMP phosphodiesterase
MLIAQITDLHAGITVDVDGRAIDTTEGARRAVAHLNALSPSPDAVVVTGDLVAEERLDHYLSVAKVLGELTMPVYLIPGNHDDRALMREVFGEHGYFPADTDFLHYTVETFELRLVALDTHDPGKISGLMCEERLAWLDQRLTAAPDRPTLIVMHHPPFATGIPEFDAIGLHGAAAFAEVITRHPQVQAIACGHVHRDIVTARFGTLVTITPSTGWQYALQLIEGPRVVRVAEPPATLLFRWDSNSGLTCHLSFLKG